MKQKSIVLVLVEVYELNGVPADQLPYTDDFESLYAEVVKQTGETLSRSECWKLLATTRKRGKLPRVSR